MIFFSALSLLTFFSLGGRSGNKNEKKFNLMLKRKYNFRI